MTLDDYIYAAEKVREKYEPSHGNNRSAAYVMWLSALPFYANQAARDGVNIDYFCNQIEEAMRFFQDFLTATQPAFPKHSLRPLWSHQRFGLFNQFNPQNDIDIRKIKEIAESYINRPMIYFELFSWCLVDSLLFAEISSFYRIMMSTQYGGAPANPAYFLAKGNEKICTYLKPFFFLFGLIVNYISPVIVGYFLVEAGHEIIGGLLYAIAGIGAFSFLATYPKRVKRQKHNKAMLQKTLEIYNLLNNENMPRHQLQLEISKATDLGVRFDKTILSLIKNDQSIANSLSHTHKTT